jgi:hypothetical protein
MKDPAVATARTIWLGILGSVGVFYVVLRMSARPSAPDDPSSFVIFTVCALAGAVASLFLPPYFHRQGTLRAALETRAAESAITADSNTTTRRVLVDSEKARALARQLYQSALVLSLALSESVALFGLLLGLRGFPEERVLPFFVASLALIALRYPRASAPARMLETSAQARFPHSALTRE